MDSRLENVLALVIEDFIRTAEPVGSQALVTEHGLDVSPATVRNWFAELEMGGMLVQPHTSAGRIPSEGAYRWYVESRLGEPEAGKRERNVFQRISEETKELPQRVKAAAKACAVTTGVAAIAGTGSSDSYYTGLTELFRQPEFRDWSRAVSMGTVLDKLDERLTELRRRSFDIPTVLLGRDCPFGDACGSVLMTLPGRSILILLGPLRMPYRQARDLLYAASQELI